MKKGGYEGMKIIPGRDGFTLDGTPKELYDYLMLLTKNQTNKEKLIITDFSSFFWQRAGKKRKGE